MEPLELLGSVAQVFERLGTPYFVTGSVAAMAWGEYRTTRDVDIVARLRYGDIDELLSVFVQPEHYLSREGILFAMEHEGMFNIIHVPTALKADIIVTDGQGFNKERLQRAVRREYLPGRSAMFSTPEDVIIHKMKFFREGGSDKHLRDIAGIVKVCEASLDSGYIETWAESFGVADVWRTILERIAAVERGEAGAV